MRTSLLSGFFVIMFRKRIEIFHCLLLGAPALMTPVVGCASETEGIRRLWAAQTFPVQTEQPRPARPLPPPSGADVGPPAPEDAAQAAHPADLPDSYFWGPQDRRQLQFNLHRTLSRHSPGLLGGFELPQIATPETRWQPRPSGGGWSAGAARWNTRLDAQTEVSLGNSEFVSTHWEDSLRLSGISLSQHFLASSKDDTQWNYSFALGAVDQSSAGANDLQFGPAAGAMAVSYDYSERLNLAARTEVASDLLMTGFSTQYDFGPMGRWRSAVARSLRGQEEGWRYRAMGDIDILDDLTLGWMGERHTDGFMDVRRHAANANTVGGARQRWSASWDVGRWGEWSGSFETVQDRNGVRQRRFGLQQQFWYGSRLRIGIHAEREVVADDYDIGLRFSFPLY